MLPVTILSYRQCLKHMWRMQSKIPQSGLSVKGEQEGRLEREPPRRQTRTTKVSLLSTGFVLGEHGIGVSRIETKTTTHKYDPKKNTPPNTNTLHMFKEEVWCRG